MQSWGRRSNKASGRILKREKVWKEAGRMRYTGEGYGQRGMASQTLDEGDAGRLYSTQVERKGERDVVEKQYCLSD